ncbi:MAG: CBS domain-containing protein [Nitrospirae bacterium]|nr:CBS domain-containing protein [Nitrospirota bacterium]MBI3351851.1 CBS domain-containing protein [Nitrospirota bacterium]
MIKIKQIMTKNPVKVEAQKTVREVINLMAEKKLGSLLIRKGDDIVGIIEEADIIRKVLGKDLNPYVTKVEDVMSVPFVIDQEKTDNEASDMMFQNHVRHLAVTEDSKIIGIVSMYDLIRPVYGGKTFWT